MALSLKQRTILSHCQIYGQITLSEAMGLIDTHHCHGEKHVGAAMSRMVDAGLLIRVKPGVFIAGKGKKSKPATIDNNQTELFK